MTESLRARNCSESGRSWRRTVERFIADGAEGDEARYVRDLTREDEVAAVDGCLRRLVTAELDIDDARMPIGRFANVVAPPGRLYRSALVRASDENKAEARDAVMDTLMIGYFWCCLLEVTARTPIKVVLGRAERDIWRCWVPHITGGSPKEHFGFAVENLKTPHALAAKHLSERFKALRLLPRFGKRIRLQVLGESYADAGIVLRLMQSMPDAPMQNNLFNALAVTWQYDDYDPEPTRPTV
jgi:hypothetical protein